MTTAWEQLTALSNNTPGSALDKFNAITTGGTTGTMISDGYSIEYTTQVYSIDLRQQSAIEVSTSILDISVLPNSSNAELNVGNVDLLVSSNDTINIEVN